MPGTPIRAIRSNEPLRRRGRDLDIRPIALVIGYVLIVIAAAMLLPMVVDMVVGHSDWEVFFISFLITLFFGVALVLMNRAEPVDQFGAREAFLLTTLSWLSVAVFATMPFYLSELSLTLGESFFEAMSGLTTTGSTVIVGLDRAPPGVLMWRALLQWMGGIGIIVLGIVVLPMLNVGGMQLFRTESSDHSEKILPRAGQLASAIGSLYLTLTLLCGIAYWLGGMTGFEATAHAMTTIATGGYSTSDASIGHFQSAFIEWTAIAFMILGGLPFVVLIRFLNGDHAAPLRDHQLRWFLGMLLAAWLILCVWLFITAPYLDGHTVVRWVIFSSTSVMTGTGYAVTDYGTWGPLAIAVFYFLMSVGGCTGSTTGGIKVFRFAVLYSTTILQVRRLIQPSGVFRPTFEGRLLPEAAMVSVLAFFFVFAVSFSVIVIALSLFDLSFITAMSSALTALANVGPGLGPQVGPASTFADLPEGAKWVMAFAMLLGRLELFTVLVLFAPAFWRV
ncbi:MAG: TrkH family potassium uptake protein [Geminicoccaceae bacterium]